MICNLKDDTILTMDEIKNLIPAHITTRKELNEWEQHNMLQAEQWAFNGPQHNIMSSGFLQQLHKKMFNKTWKWAGQFYAHQNGIECESAYISQKLASAFNDAFYQMHRNVYSIREMYVRLHHRLVLIHPFTNGNRKTARLLVDLLLFKNQEPVFTWGSCSRLKSAGELYLNALKEADRGDYSKLISFADS